MTNCTIVGNNASGNFFGGGGINNLVGMVTMTTTIVAGNTALSGPDVHGTVTSGGYSPTLGAPVAMGYVAPEQAVPDTRLRLEARGKPLAATVVRLPFVPHRYHRL